MIDRTSLLTNTDLIFSSHLSVLQSQNLKTGQFFLRFCSIKTNKYVLNSSAISVTCFMHVPYRFDKAKPGRSPAWGRARRGIAINQQWWQHRVSSIHRLNKVPLKQPLLNSTHNMKRVLEDDQTHLSILKCKTGQGYVTANIN